LANKALDLWQGMFESTGGAAKNSYTCELHLLASERVVFTADVENTKAILTTQFQDFGKGPQFHREWKDFLGDSIFSTDRQQWHDSRNLIRPMFQRERVADLDIVETHVRKVINLMGPGDGRMIRLDKILFRFSLDASTDFLYGRSVNSLDRESEFATAFDEVQRVQVLEGRLGPLRHWHSRRSFYAALKKMDKFMQPFIAETLALSPEELESKLSKSDTFIHAMARFTRDPKMIRDQITSLLLAGRDTTASTLSWLFLELSRNPRVVEKLRAEIKDMLGDSGRPPTYQEIKDMRYLTWTINETLRLYPVVPFNVRTALKDTTLPHGAGRDGLDPVGVLKDTPVGYSTLLMQRRRDLYPPISETFPYDPLDWVPERWATWTPKAWQFIPFNGGPRICIGMNFAMSEMGYTIIRILQEFEQIIDYGNTSTLKCEIVVTPADGVNVGFVKNKKEESKA
jgi:cytochrome P450